jgi:hypothetical protein
MTDEFMNNVEDPYDKKLQLKKISAVNISLHRVQWCKYWKLTDWWYCRSVPIL